MRPLLPSPLPQLDCSLLHCARRLVPGADREDWLRTWQAELWCMHHRRRGSRGETWRVSADLFTGLAMDALWLRTESWRRALSGTPALCLAVLLGFCVLSGLTAWLLGEGRQASGSLLGGEALRCLLAAPLVIFVTTATVSSRHMEPGSASRRYRQLRRLFFAVKTALALLLAFLLSADVCQPITKPFPATASLLQILVFVVFSIFGLRWAFRDQEARCKQCLRSLTMPARVGRPSHNLLEWSGTEQSCRRGHGLLSLPEMETCWRQYGQWFDHEPAA